MNSHWKDRCWSSSILVTWYEELIRWKSPRCWERLRAEGEEGVRGWDGWMAYWCNRHEIGQPSGVVEGQAGLACCSPWGHKELDTTVWLSNNNDKRDWKYSVYERLGQTTLIPKTNLKTTGGICKKVSFWKFWADQNWIGYSLRKCIQGSSIKVWTVCEEMGSVPQVALAKWAPSGLIILIYSVARGSGCWEFGDQRLGTWNNVLCIFHIQAFATTENTARICTSKDATNVSAFLSSPLSQNHHESSRFLFFWINNRKH